MKAKTKVVIYWITKEREKIDRIRKKFDLGNYVSVNGETPADISNKDMDLLVETERRGYIEIRIKEDKKA